MQSNPTPELQRLEARITELEIKASFAEDLVDHLNQTVVRQQQQIEFLAAQLRELKQQSASDGGPATRSLRDELPPHY
ncbi:SlyX family protein [Roseateles sp. BYS180W]|uniref:SlyX family protein n=2 Tax=Roseateles rivi TaxID=3299028 RepID=A0ABW7FSS2_9BURK